MNKSYNSNNSSKTNQRQRQNAQSVAVPSNAFVALYPYKPQKSDELELKKGCKSPIYEQSLSKTVRLLVLILFCFS